VAVTITNCELHFENSICLIHNTSTYTPAITEYIPTITEHTIFFQNLEHNIFKTSPWNRSCTLTRWSQPGSQYQIDPWFWFDLMGCGRVVIELTARTSASTAMPTARRPTHYHGAVGSHANASRTGLLLLPWQIKIPLWGPIMNLLSPFGRNPWKCNGATRSLWLHTSHHQHTI